MNIILAAAEVAPFAKAGGLADITSSLPTGWRKYGKNPIVVLPKYAGIDTGRFGFRPTGLVLCVPMSYWTEYGHLWYGTLPNSDIPVYLIENKDYFDRPGIYGNPDEYPDNDRRFIFFSRAVMETAKALNITPDIIHAHDYHAAFTMAFLKSQYLTDPRFSRTAGVYTIHNLAYQGWFNPGSAMDLSTFGMSQFYPGSWFEHRGSVNAMKVGLMFADKITTVSPNYAKEIRYPYFSEGMQDVLNLRGGDLIGILNGIFYDEWSPDIDNTIYTKYSSEFLMGKMINKHQFLKEQGLTEDDNLDLPLIGIVTRLAEQKGIDLIMNKLESYLGSGSFRLALLGSGNRNYEDYFRYIAWKYPGKAFVYIGYNNNLSHKIIAASDYFMLPSRFEPCGLTQMYALKYGTIPIVRFTGGLADSVREYVPGTGEGTGFVFYQYNADDLAYAIHRALDIYGSNPHWDIIRKNAMNEDFSSDNSALEYLKVFQWALEKVRGI
jgi:starch synthase